MKYQRLIPLLTPLLILMLSAGFFFDSMIFYYALILGVVLIILSIKLLTTGHNQSFWRVFLATPVLFYISFTWCSAMVGDYGLPQFILILLIIFIFLYLRNLY